MRVGLRHTTRLHYDADVLEGVMDVRVGPLSDADQRWESFELRVAPNASVRPYTDGFGNAAHLVTIARPHRFVDVTSFGVVQTLLADPFAPPRVPPRPLGPSELADALGPSVLVPEDRDVQALAEPHRPASPAGAFDAVQALMDLVYRGFSYQQHVTSVGTTVAEVLQARSGVCQDFAHVLIGLCRAVGIPARYVSGYIVQRAQSQSQAQAGGSQSQSQSQSQRQGPARGAGASHAWAEAYTSSHGWRGFDPTNNLVASEYHVKMGIGRDYADVPPTRGTFRGSADERLSVDVATEVLD